MIYFLDAYYFENNCRTACVGISEWTSEKILFEKSETTTGIKYYESGAFFKRELPGLTHLLQKIELVPEEDIIVIDGFVYLDDLQKPGLGAYLYNFLNSEIPVIGVAKNDFPAVEKLKQEVFRGKSAKPLYVTAAGMDLNMAAAHVKSMLGEYRIPTVFKVVDRISRRA